MSPPAWEMSVVATGAKGPVVPAPTSWAVTIPVNASVFQIVQQPPVGTTVAKALAENAKTS